MTRQIFVRAHDRPSVLAKRIGDRLGPVETQKYAGCGTTVGQSKPREKLPAMMGRAILMLASCAGRAREHGELTQMLHGKRKGGKRVMDIAATLNGLWERKLVTFPIDDHVQITREGLKVARSLKRKKAA